jgi:hypothetical protein
MNDLRLIVDAHAYLGQWFPRRLTQNTAEELLALMDQVGIRGAVVGSASGIMYRNCQSGNEELAMEIEGHRDRLVPFGVINPNYVGWEEDLRWCVDALGACGVRIYPQYDDYRLSDACCAELCSACREHDLTIAVSQRVEDYRQKREVLCYSDLVLDEMARLFQEHPDVTFMVLNGSGFPASRLVTDASGLPPNYVVEISRPSVFIRKELQAIAQAIGADRLVFGSGMPIATPGPALIKLEHLPVSESERAGVAGANLVGLLGLSGWPSAS